MAGLGQDADLGVRHHTREPARRVGGVEHRVARADDREQRHPQPPLGLVVEARERLGSRPESQPPSETPTNDARAIESSRTTSSSQSAYASEPSAGRDGAERPGSPITSMA